MPYFASNDEIQYSYGPFETRYQAARFCARKDGFYPSHCAPGHLPYGHQIKFIPEDSEMLGSSVVASARAVSCARHLEQKDFSAFPDDMKAKAWEAYFSLRDAANRIAEAFGLNHE